MTHALSLTQKNITHPQLLFARLKYSRHRAAVATQPLTHSFHWTQADAFRQHDVQELMRVLFQALERACSKEVAAAAAAAASASAAAVHALEASSSLTPSSSPQTVRQTSGDGSTSASGGESSADVFNRLYSGAIRDFIRCRECGHARERRDKFMDLALVVADMR